MSRRIWIDLLIAGCCLVVAEMAWADSVVEAKSNDVKVYAEGNKTSSVIKTLQKGESLPAEDRAGMYWQVKVGEQTGFVSVMSVTRKAKEGGGLAVALRQAARQEKESNESKNLRSRSAVMGVRGLDESKDLDFVGNVRPNMRMVYAMGNFEIPASEIEKISEGVFKEIEEKANSK